MAIVAGENAIEATDDQKKEIEVVGKDMLATQRTIMKNAMMPKPKKEEAKGGKKKSE